MISWGRPELHFIYGAMGSAKTAHLLLSSHHFLEKGVSTCIVVPSVDTRVRKGSVESRAGMKSVAAVVCQRQRISDAIGGTAALQRIGAIFADEVNFLSVKQVDELASIVDNLGIPVFAYGIRTDFRTRFFPGTRRLMEIADRITEMDSLCPCGRKAVVNARYFGSRIFRKGPQILIGGNESYMALCRKCWKAGNIPKTKRGLNMATFIPVTTI